LAALLLISGCREGEHPRAGAQAQIPVAGPKPAPPTPQRQAARARRGPRPSADIEEVVLTLTLPPANEKLATEAVSGHGSDCPQSRLSALLGVGIASPHGVVIGQVLPEGLGAKAGIKPGDSIVEADGARVTCPSSLMPRLTRTDKLREVKLTVIRAKHAAAPQPAPAPTAK